MSTLFVSSHDQSPGMLTMPKGLYASGNSAPDSVVLPDANLTVRIIG